jgi:hypothetical protein
MRFKVISCEAFRGEVTAAVARSRHRTDLEFVQKELASGGPTTLARVQEVVDRSSGGDYDAIVLGWPRCASFGAGLEARDTPLVVPCAHDAFHAGGAAGSFSFQSTGWTESERLQGGRLRLMQQESDADFDSYTMYRQLIYINTPHPANHGHIVVPALDPALLDRLLSGNWTDGDFLTVPPGWRLKTAPDGRLVGEPIA